MSITNRQFCAIAKMGMAAFAAAIPLLIMAVMPMAAVMISAIVIGGLMLYFNEELPDNRWEFAALIVAAFTYLAVVALTYIELAARASAGTPAPILFVNIMSILIGISLVGGFGTLIGAGALGIAKAYRYALSTCPADGPTPTDAGAVPSQP